MPLSHQEPNGVARAAETQSLDDFREHAPILLRYADEDPGFFRGHDPIVRTKRTRRNQYSVSARKNGGNQSDAGASPLIRTRIPGLSGSHRITAQCAHGFTSTPGSSTLMNVRSVCLFACSWMR